MTQVQYENTKMVQTVITRIMKLLSFYLIMQLKCALKHFAATPSLKNMYKN